MKQINNIKKFYFYSTFTNLLILGPIITLFLLYKGLNFTQIMLLGSIMSVGIVMLEVPTGAVADLIGRKLSVILGISFNIVSLILYIIGDAFWVFAIAEFIFALGLSFKSGADTALLYDSLKLNGLESEYKHIQSKVYSFVLLAQIPGSIIASYVYEINKNLPLIISIAFLGLSMIFAFMLNDVKAYEKHEEKPKYITQIKESFKYIFTHKKVKAIVIFSMFFFAFYRIGFWQFQPYFQAVEIPIRYFGFIFAGFNLVAAVCSRYCAKITKWARGKLLSSLLYIMGISFLLLFLVRFPIGILFMALQQVTRGLYNPTLMKYLNKHIPTNKRATIISAQSLLANFAAAIFMPLIGIIMDNTDIFSVHMWLTIMIIPGTVVISIYLNKVLARTTDFSKVER